MKELTERTHCLHGHPLENNVYMWVYKSGPKKGRLNIVCKSCTRERYQLKKGLVKKTTKQAIKKQKSIMRQKKLETYAQIDEAASKFRKGQK